MHPHSIVSPLKLNGDLVKLQVRNSFKSATQDIILCCLYVADGLIAVGNKDGSLIFYDDNGTVTRNLAQYHKSSICSMAVIGDGQYLATGSDHPHPEIILWNLSTLDYVGRLK